MKELVLSYPDSKGLPEKVIANIVKIACDQNKGNDSKWFLRMLADAKKKNLQAMEAKALKESKKLKPVVSKIQDSLNSENKLLEIPLTKEDIREVPKNIKPDEKNVRSQREPLFQKDEDEHLLPYIKDLRSLYPMLKDSAWFYILQNYGQWPLRVMAVFPERERLFPQWTVQAAATLKDVGLKKILELGLDKDHDALYVFLKRNAKFYDHFYHRMKYKRHIKNIVNEFHETEENKEDRDKSKEVQK